MVTGLGPVVRELNETLRAVPDDILKRTWFHVDPTNSRASVNFDERA